MRDRGNGHGNILPRGKYKFIYTQMEQEMKECVTHRNNTVTVTVKVTRHRQANERTNGHTCVRVYTQSMCCVCLYTFTYYYMIRCASSITLGFCCSEPKYYVCMWILNKKWAQRNESNRLWCEDWNWNWKSDAGILTHTSFRFLFETFCSPGFQITYKLF